MRTSRNYTSLLTSKNDYQNGYTISSDKRIERNLD